MKIAYIMNCIDRFHVTQEYTGKNLSNAGAHCDLRIFTDNGSHEQDAEKLRTWIRGTCTHPIINDENIGNAQALNNALKLAFEDERCDAVCIMGNDIIMPNLWLKRAIDYADAIPETGIIGWSWRGKQFEIATINNLQIEPATDVGERIFGSWYLPRRVWERCGYFSTFSRYGLWDSDFNVRVHTAGFLRYYLPGMHSDHPENDWMSGTPYRKMKDAEMTKAKEGIDARIQEVKQTGKYFVTFDNRLI